LTPAAAGPEASRSKTFPPQKQQNSKTGEFPPDSVRS
jgi:hypothetical protein